MKREIALPFLADLARGLSRHPEFIHVLIGPRQTGKTTGIQKFLEGLRPGTFRYVTADGPLQKSADWLAHEWRLLQSEVPDGLLVVDEVQKVEGWSEAAKLLWDQQKRKTLKLRLVVLGSSSLQIQKGLSESLTGRFVLYRTHQWNLSESRQAYGMDFEDFLRFGGYPGSYELIENREQWLSYMKESIVDTVIGRDILQLARVKSPALFRQCFDLACGYGGQELSYNKLLGQLQSRGNVELVKHYLELFEGAFLLKQLFKYSSKRVLTRTSSPKILPLCPALYSLTRDAELDESERGRAFEIAVGCEIMRFPGHLHYWRHGSFEVDYVYSYGKKLWAIEVKSGRKKPGASAGLNQFLKEFPKAEALILSPENWQEVLHRIRV